MALNTGRKLKNVSLDITSGEFVALVGPSGSGKSTLLRLIAGLEAVNSGSVRVDGVDVTDTEPSERDMAMVFQSYALYPHMSVAENMTFALRMRNAPADEVDRRLNMALDMLGLRGFESRKPGQLSGGQRQRVAMGRAIVRQPAVFLFDEPLSNLDAKLRARTRVELRDLHDRLGATSVFVTHDQIEAMTMADRIVLLEGGVLQQVGTPKEIYRNPVNRFVAGFIGSPEINFLTGVLGQAEGAATLDGVKLSASADRLQQLQKAQAFGRRFEIGIRPDQLRLTGAGPGIDLQVIATEFTGQDLYVTGTAAGTQITLRLDPQTQTEAQSLARGAQISVAPAEDQWHVFDLATGLSLTAT
jgi:ABC-type sugar transport system ATPase subunit